MKTLRYTFYVAIFSFLVSSCSVFGSNKRGCPAGAVGAEKVLDGGKQPKQKKFRA